MWGELVVESLVRPRAAAGRVLALRLPLADLLAAAVLLACLGTLLSHFALGAGAVAVNAMVAPLLRNPLAGAASELAWMATVALLTARVGKSFGGSGSLAGAIALVVWLTALMVLVQVVQLVALMVLPPTVLVAGLVIVAPMLWLLWTFANFVAELHGFRNPLLVLGGVILTMILLLITIGMLLAILGLTPQETA